MLLTTDSCPRSNSMYRKYASQRQINLCLHWVICPDTYSKSWLTIYASSLNLLAELEFALVEKKFL